MNTLQPVTSTEPTVSVRPTPIQHIGSSTFEGPVHDHSVLPRQMRVDVGNIDYEDTSILPDIGLLNIADRSQQKQDVQPCTSVNRDIQTYPIDRTMVVQKNNNPSPNNGHPISKSEQASENRPKPESNLVRRLFSHSAFSRTIIPSLGRRTSRNSTIFVQSMKGRSTFHHRTTIDVLPHGRHQIDVHADHNAHNLEAVDRPQTGSSSTVSSESRYPYLANRSDSLKNDRRGRSLFRSSKHKRSRAPAPGRRRNRGPAFDDNGTECRVRRESPEPGYRTRDSSCRLRTRKVRGRISERQEKRTDRTKE